MRRADRCRDVKLAADTFGRVLMKSSGAIIAARCAKASC